MTLRTVPESTCKTEQSTTLSSCILKIMTTVQSIFTVMMSAPYALLCQPLIKLYDSKSSQAMILKISSRQVHSLLNHCTLFSHYEAGPQL